MKQKFNLKPPLYYGIIAFIICAIGIVSFGTLLIILSNITLPVFMYADIVISTLVVIVGLSIVFGNRFLVLFDYSTTYYKFFDDLLKCKVFEEQDIMFEYDKWVNEHKATLKGYGINTNSL